MTALYRRIKQKREELGISQDELAQRLGYKHRSSIQKIEAGLTDLPLSKVQEFADAMQTTAEWLMGWQDEKEMQDVMNRFADPVQCRSREEEVFCHGLVKLLRDGVPLERIDVWRIRLAAEQYRAEYTEQLEQENARAQERIEAKKRSWKSLDGGDFNDKANLGRTM